ncbi:unnamed protein product [Microthlaspi erraticum]|uniref:Transposase Tnp1/En/Spm-like domain-containing protein n=1 Tax=Microthlaspi erraticum TaxID=1685480 RepID=A0A6D2K4K3_9BRAS|nr:unnamed protein product [Microthlaspi erraticum]
MPKGGRSKKDLKKRKNQLDEDVEPEYMGPDSQQQTQEHEADEQAGEEVPTTHTEEDPVPNAAAIDDASIPIHPKPKRHRGPTKMKDTAKDPNTKVRVEFNDLGEPYGGGSVTLSSYLGPLVREHVPIIIDGWRKICEERRTILWKSVQARFELEGDYEKEFVLKQMGCLWRSSKSRVVGKIMKAKNNAERMQLRPKNVPIADWRKFIKAKTSAEFKAISDTYKERRQKQIPHTYSRKGMVRLAEDMKKESSEPSDVTRLNVWVKSRTRKDGTAVNTNAADKIKKATELVQTQSPSTNPREDMLAQVLGPDNPGRLRAMGRSMNMSKLALFQMRNKYMAELQKNQACLQQQVQELQNAILTMKTQRPDPEVGENSAPRVKDYNLSVCCLIGLGVMRMAEGRLVSSEAEEKVNGIPLGPNSVKVLVETAVKADAFLWRPAQSMCTIGEAVGEMVAWPQNFAVVFDQGTETEDTALKSPTATSPNMCKLLDWASNSEEVVAVGRWQCNDRKALVNGLPLGPNAVKVIVDEVMEPDTFLWRPTAELLTLEDCLKSFVAWPVSRVVTSGVAFETPYTFPQHEESVPTPPAPTKKAQSVSESPSQHSAEHQISQPVNEVVDKTNKKCLLMDISGRGGSLLKVVGRQTTQNTRSTLFHWVQKQFVFGWML